MANRSVLLIDANGSALRQARITLEFEGLDVVEARDGEAGLDEARNRKPELVISAVGLPGSNGYELCRALRAENQLAKTPVILTYSSMDVFDAARAERVGAAASLAKPFLPSQLLDIISQVKGVDFLGSDHRDMAGASLSPETALTSAESAFLEDSTDEPRTLESDFVSSVDDALGGPGGTGNVPFAAMSFPNGAAASAISGSSGPSFSRAKAARPGMGPPAVRLPEQDLQSMVDAAVERYLDERLAERVAKLVDEALRDRKS